ncbi:hypothetical protein [Pseudozobellia thermophila]|uniref:Uncharacterized protein n=1 Tax=Pseudozobellia thermophila TaxID=192903 RepID=A0A1M6C9B8_9FLAO|nr:hypothetical protein [Pseudozobellia thermophila]SHI57612.1 hypothetical protein SAMN04488513_101689 [Pseudozobellia thermophila]
MKTGAFFLLLLLAVPQGFCQKGIDLGGDKLLIEIFNPSQIQGLESIVRYVDHRVLEGRDTADANEAYHLFLEEMALFNDKAAKPPGDKVPFQEEEKYKFLEAVDASLFNAVWKFEDHSGVLRYKDTVYRNLKNFKSLKLRPFGKYMDYMGEIGKNDPYFLSLRKQMGDVGNLSAGSAYGFVKNHANFDFNVPKNRLWAAIYLISIEEDYETKLDRYFKAQ